ncbi:glycoside hydrolase family 125 protein [Paenibacillus aurantiacus]|uniref:Glycoside hydrolase family 125 protein n=1 Tax=Paenibacillus aurantiacus TaxID=1936118 RepID=A0ABV5L117_9BACL
MSIPMPLSITKQLDAARGALAHRPKLLELYANCFPNTLQTTTKLLDDGTSFVFTGDIPAMWLRDSSAQVRQYLPFAREDADLRRILEGLIERQFLYIGMDPYANAFNEEPNGKRWDEDLAETNPWVWERKYELDSLCYPIQLGYLYWKETGRDAVFKGSFDRSIRAILRLMETEQYHMEKSDYRFSRTNCPAQDTLRNQGRGMPVGYTGMVWSGFRPSDDACTFGYHIPSNMFAAVVLGYVREIAETVMNDAYLAAWAARLEDDIRYGIETYGIYRHPVHGPMYAYETDGFGHYALMDDANVPSLLAIPYLGYTDAANPVYMNTRRFILSPENPYFYRGTAAEGIGSPHTPPRYIWPISLTMQALTSTSEEEVGRIVAMLERTDAGTGFMHEGFHVDDPAQFTRPWFAWANSLFSELITGLMKDGKLG